MSAKAQADIRGNLTVACRKLSMSTFRLILLSNEIDRDPLSHIRSQLQRVPIGQAHASVRLRLANLSWLWSAMNTVTFTRQTDPNDTHRIVGTRLYREGLRGPNPFECVGRIVTVCGIFLYNRYLQSAARRWLFLASRGHRIIGQQFAAVVECSQLLLGLVDLDAVNLPRQRLCRHVGNHDHVASHPKFLPRIER